MATMVETVNMGRHEQVGDLSGEASRAGIAKNILLFLAAPVIGLAYIIAFPFVGMAALLRLAVRALV